MALIFASVDTLETRREQLTERFFRRNVLRETSCLHYLLADNGIQPFPLKQKNFESRSYRTV